MCWWRLWAEMGSARADKQPCWDLLSSLGNVNTNVFLDIWGDWRESLWGHWRWGPVHFKNLVDNNHHCCLLLSKWISSFQSLCHLDLNILNWIYVFYIMSNCFKESTKTTVETALSLSRLGVTEHGGYMLCCVLEEDFRGLLCDATYNHPSVDLTFSFATFNLAFLSAHAPTPSARAWAS